MKLASREVTKSPESQEHVFASLIRFLGKRPSQAVGCWKRQRPPGPQPPVLASLASCAESHPRMGKGRCFKCRIRAALLRRQARSAPRRPVGEPAPGLPLAAAGRSQGPTRSRSEHRPPQVLTQSPSSSEACKHTTNPLTPLFPYYFLLSSVTLALYSVSRV